MKVHELINGPYRDYSLYVLYFRAIPSMIDGLKTSQRKILWTAMKCAKDFMKTSALGASCIIETDYHHGETSLHDAASLMAGTWRNQLPLLDGDGNFGSRIINAAGAARYTSVRISKRINDIFLDTDICERQEGREPVMFFPILPILAINGAEGTAVGFSTSVLPRSVQSVKSVVSDILEGRMTKEEAKRLHLPPEFPMFNGVVETDHKPDNPGWIVSGKIIRLAKKAQIEICELPYGIEREEYIGRLSALETSGQIINYTDLTTKGSFRFHVKLSDELNGLPERELLKRLKLTTRVSENITAVDPTNTKIVTYESIGELIWDFVEFRTSIYTKRFLSELESLESDIVSTKLRIDFILGCMELPPRLTRAMQKQKISQILIANGHSIEKIDYLLDSTPVSHLNNEKVEELTKKVLKLEERVKEVKSMNERTEYIKDLYESK